MPSPHAPIVGASYSVICPQCFSAVTFHCADARLRATRCTVCSALIDLRDPSSVLADGESEQAGPLDGPLLYAGDVEQSGALSAASQLHQVIHHVEEEKKKSMPERMTGETTQAFSAQRNQALAEKFSFFYPFTYALEYVVFGNKPTARLGHVRVFRKRVPLVGVVNFVAPRTTTSYAAPSCFTFATFSLYNWFVHHMQLSWMHEFLFLEWILVFFFYFLLFQLAYSDPGYIKPGYMEHSDHGGRTTDELTLRAIEQNQKESVWEDVNGVPMEKKWCSTCEMHRPLRAAHCYICGLCCYDHDHHCSVIGVCVGRRKLEMFTTFVSVAASACVVPSTTTAYACWHHWALLETNLQVVLTGLMWLPVTMFACLLSFTAVSMWQSIFLEASTRERIQRVYANKKNPYDRGMWKNLVYHLWQRRVAPSLFDDDFVKKCAMRQEERELGTGVTVTCI